MNGTKYLLLLCDGLADEPAPGQPTPMEAARLPHMDALAACGELGTVRTVPPGMTPGSDVAMALTRPARKRLARPSTALAS